MPVFIGYEGSDEAREAQKKLIGEIVSSHNGICIGSSPGEMYDQKKFDTPYIRDLLLDRTAGSPTCRRRPRRGACCRSSTTG